MKIRVLLAVLCCAFSISLFSESRETTFLSIRNSYGSIQATLDAPRQPGKIAVVQAHPWGGSLASYPAAELASKGFAVLSLNTRSVNKDSGEPNEILEDLLLDVAAGVQEMKDRGYEKIILMGGSAGGPLMSLYQRVAENGNAAFAGDKKVFRFPGFFQENGEQLKLPPGDGLIFRNPISGTSTSFLNRLDPSVKDEVTGKRDPALDMFNPDNGFDPETGLASYSPEFVKKYEKEQAARMNRLIDEAHKKQAEVEKGRGRFADGGLMIISGTRARLMYTDMALGHGNVANLILPQRETAIPKHDRAPGHYSLFGDVGDRNSSVEGAVVHNLRSFLSMRAIRADFINPNASTLAEWGVDVNSANSTTVGSLMHVSAPWVIFAGTADDKINTAELIHHEAKSQDKTVIILRGATHGITSVDPSKFLKTTELRALMVDEIAKWIQQRFK